MKERDNVRPMNEVYEDDCVLDFTPREKSDKPKSTFWPVFITGLVLGAIAGGLGVYYLSR